MSPIKLPKFNLAAIEAGSVSVTDSFRESLSNLGAVVVNVPGFAELHTKSLSVSRSLWGRCARREEFVQEGEAIAIPDGELMFDFAGVTYWHTVRKLVLGERGWLERKSSPSGADKEYFQYGLIRSCPPGGYQQLKANCWPVWDNSRMFHSVKRRQIEMHERVHAALFSVYSNLVDLYPNERSWPKSFETICRETFYYPICAKDAGGGANERNFPHVDLSNSTLIRHAPGLQIYGGISQTRDHILRDDKGWLDIETEELSEDDAIYITGLATEIGTRGLLRALWHRVIAGSAQEAANGRLSIVSFFNAGNDDFLRGGANQHDRRNTYPPIDRSFLPIVGNAAYFESVR